MESWANMVQRVVNPSPIPFSSLGQIYNLGTGTGYSVLQMVQAMEKASGKKVSCQSRPPVPSSELACREWGWERKLQHSLNEIHSGCQSSPDHPSLADTIQGGGTARR